MKFSLESQGSFDNTESFLRRVGSGSIFSTLDRYGAEGVAALVAATPKDSGISANSWIYEVVKTRKSYSIVWSNTNLVDGTPLVILLQYGHGTGTGGFVQGRDFINPALQPLFDRIAADMWKEVTK